MFRPAAFLIATLASACVLHASTLLTENFDELTPQLDVKSAGAFTAIGGTNVDIVGAANGFGYLCVGPETGNCLDMDGTNGNPQGTITSAAFVLLPGVNYYLSFDLIGSNRGVTTSTTVSFASYDNTFVLDSGDESSGVVTDALITVLAPTRARLIFASNTPGQIGAVLDNVSITANRGTTPEPSTVALIIGPLIAALYFGIRRSRGLARI